MQIPIGTISADNFDARHALDLTQTIITQDVGSPRDQLSPFWTPAGTSDLPWMGLVVEDLVETRPPVGVQSTYRSSAETEWARHWPMENIWKLRKE